MSIRINATRGSSALLNPTRRTVLRAGVGLGFMASGFGAMAQGMIGQTEWTEGFDATTPLQPTTRSQRPSLSPATASFTEQAIAQYSNIVSQGGWPQVPSDSVLKIGQASPAVSTLRQRLTISGDLAPVGGFSESFDSFVDAAVKRFQRRHGLIADGAVANDTVRRMNVSADVRLRQLEMNLARVKPYEKGLGDRYVMVNVPGAEIETVDGDTVHSRHQGIVGKIDRQTPLLTTKITLIKFNPFWTVPKSLILKDLIPQMQKDPSYLERQKIRIYDPQGVEVSWQTIDWNSEDAVKYLFRQDPGDINSMGSVKIEFPSPEGVYMHDTPAKGLFGGNDRFHSSGCVRVQNVREYVYWILKNTPDWPQERIAQALVSGERLDAPVVDPVPLYFQYVTAWADSEGTVQFRDDIYQRDGLDIALQ